MIIGIAIHTPGPIWFKRGIIWVIKFFVLNDFYDFSTFKIRDRYTEKQKLMISNDFFKM